MAALAAAQSQEAVGQDAAPQERVELVLDEPRQLRAGGGLGVRDEAGRMPDGQELSDPLSDPHPLPTLRTLAKTGVTATSRQGARVAVGGVGHGKPATPT